MSQPRQIANPLRGRRFVLWAAVILLLAISLSGLNDAINQLRSGGETSWQRIDTLAQLGYAALGLVAAGGLLANRRWVRSVLWAWGALVALTAGLAAVVWGESGPVVGLVAGAGAGLIAWLVIWLAGKAERSRGNLSGR